VSSQFRQVDVFTERPYQGNPVAVVHDADDLETEEMARIGTWTNLSETTFLLTPTDPSADYRVRIFSLATELPFAGHPTLGTCHAWLEAGGEPAQEDVIVQECGAGMVPIRRTDDGLAFAAPPLLRSGPVDEELVRHVAGTLGLDRDQVLAAEWADNGPGWLAVRLDSAETVLSVRPSVLDQEVGLVGPLPPGEPEAFEVRAFLPKDGVAVEDPVTGSLNASLAQWLLRTGHAEAPYVARQGTAMGRTGRVHVTQGPDGGVWVGGGTITCVTGRIEL
jgi:PhzF family phenazine biosynthesis protein